MASENPTYDNTTQYNPTTTTSSTHENPARKPDMNTAAGLGGGTGQGQGQYASTSATSTQSAAAPTTAERDFDSTRVQGTTTGAGAGYGQDSAATANPVGTRTDTAAQPASQSTATTTGTSTAAAATETAPSSSNSKERGGLLGSIKGRMAQGHGIGEAARGTFNAKMDHLMGDEKGEARDAAIAEGGKREFTYKKFENDGWDKTIGGRDETRHAK